MSKNANSEYVFIATLGLEPQVVTVVIDRLHEDFNLRFAEAVILHTQPRPTIAEDKRPDLIQASLDAVQVEMATYIRAGIVANPCYVPLRQPNGAPIYDIYSEPDAKAVFRAIDNEVQRQRAANRIIHFSAAGGRKGMTMYAMAAAQFRFRPNLDKLWLLGSTPKFQSSRALHTTSKDEAFIIPIPILPPPESFVAELEAHGKIYRDLDPRNQMLLEMIATEGLGNKEIAARMSLTDHRVEQLVRQLRQTLEDRMRLQLDPYTFREQAIRTFSPYFQWRELIDPNDEAESFPAPSAS